MILILKRKRLWIIPLVLILITLSVGGGIAFSKAKPVQEKVIVLDAGHGGADGGVVGVNSGVKESEINLLIAQSLKKLLEEQNFKVVMTRSDGNGLYPPNATNMKREDMLARKTIIHSAEPDLVLSIHCNKFPSPSRRGAQVFFEEKNPSGKAFAVCTQSALNTVNRDVAGRDFTALHGDYYILKCSPYPSAIAECGFLSNPEDDALLNDPKHREKIAYCLFSGIISYFSTSESTL